MLTDIGVHTPELQNTGQRQTGSASGSDSELEALNSLANNTFKYPSDISSMPSMSDEDKATRAEPILALEDPEIFQFEGANGEVRLAMTLTRHMISLWHRLFYCESRLEEYRRDMAELEDIHTAKDSALDQIKRLNVYPAGNVDRAVGIKTQEYVSVVMDLSPQVKQGLETNLHRTMAEAEVVVRDMARDMKPLLAANNFLERGLGYSDDGSQVSHGEEEKCEGAIGALATSEFAQCVTIEQAEAMKEAIKDMKEREEAFRKAQEQVESWEDYAIEEETKYQQRVTKGITSPARTSFDLRVLQEEMDCTRALLRADCDRDKSRQRARETGLQLYGSDLESGFGSYPSDEYTPSVEAGHIQSVDRARIERWMESDEHEQKRHGPTEEDAWESRSVEQLGSYSSAANGNERARIDRWQKKCEQISQRVGLDRVVPLGRDDRA